MAWWGNLPTFRQDLLLLFSSTLQTAIFVPDRLKRIVCDSSAGRDKCLTYPWTELFVCGQRAVFGLQLRQQYRRVSEVDPTGSCEQYQRSGHYGLTEHIELQLVGSLVRGRVKLTHWGRVTQNCVFTLQLCKTVTQICVFNTRLFSLHNTLNYVIHRACLRMVLLTDVYRNLTSLWIKL